MTTQQLQGAEKAFQVLNFWKVDSTEFIKFYEAKVKEVTDYENFIKTEHIKMNEAIRANKVVKTEEVKTEETKTKVETKKK